MSLVFAGELNWY